MNRRVSSGGFTLVELMVVVAIIGVLAAIAVQGVRVYMSHAKSAEAKQMVGAIARGAIGAYEGEHGSPEMLKGGAQSNKPTRILCGSAKPVPKKVPKGRKYQPSSATGKDFNTGSTTKGWACLKFNIDQPIYYRYTYVKGKQGIVGKHNPAKPSKNGFEAAAMGDLDGDGKRSVFALTGSVDSKTKALRTSTQLFIEQENE